MQIIASYTGRHAADEEFDPENGVIVPSDEKYDDWVTTSVSYSYDASQWGIFRVGANNVFDEDPVINPIWAERGTNRLYNTLGRVVFMEYRKTFD